MHAMATPVRAPWVCSACTFHNDSFRTRCELCDGPPPPRPLAAPSPSQSAPAPSPPPALQQPPSPPATVQPQPPPPTFHQPPPPMQPLPRITVRSIAHPRGWLLPFPHSYDELIEAAHQHIAPPDQLTQPSHLQLYVNRGRITAATFHLLRDRDVIDALHIAPPTPSTPTAAVSSEAGNDTEAATAPTLRTPAPSRKRPAPDANDSVRHSLNGVRDHRAVDIPPPHNRPHLQPPSPPAPPPADNEMPPLSPDPSSVHASASSEAAEATVAAGNGTMRVSSRQEIVVDDGMDEEAESKTPPNAPGGPPAAATAAQQPSPKHEQPIPTPPPPPPPQPQHSADTSHASSAASGRTNPSRAASVTAIIRSQYTLPHAPLLASQYGVVDGITHSRAVYVFCACRLLESRLSEEGRIWGKATITHTHCTTTIHCCNTAHSYSLAVHCALFSLVRSVVRLVKRRSFAVSSAFSRTGRHIVDTTIRTRSHAVDIETDRCNRCVTCKINAEQCQCTMCLSRLVFLHHFDIVLHNSRHCQLSFTAEQLREASKWYNGTFNNAVRELPRCCSCFHSCVEFILSSFTHPVHCQPRDRTLNSRARCAMR